MTALILATAAVLALTLFAGLTTALVFLVHITRFTAEAAAALEHADADARRLTGHIEGMQRVTHAAARDLTGTEA